MPVAVLEAMHVMLPEHAEVLTPYGATECLPVTAIDSRTLLKETRALTEAGAWHMLLAGQVDEYLLTVVLLLLGGVRRDCRFCAGFNCMLCR